MAKIDRIILIVIVLGLWALLLKPSISTAHDDNDHDCSLRGYGEIENPRRGGDVYMGNVTEDCSH
tara:strand:+ start:114 stop:308 length:195 start_codon:yes stop_codon:yes gene_type:complete